MGNMSVNKLGGLCLIIGPVLALIFYMLQPGNMIISPADTADAGASMAAFQSNAMITSLCAFLIPVGLIMWLYGIRTLNDAGDRNAWGSLGTQCILIATIGWVVSIGLQHVLAVGPGDAMAAYTISAGLSNISGLIACVGVLLLSLAFSSREGINKILSYIVAITAVISLVLNIIMLTDPSMSETALMVGGVAYIIWTIWFILGGLSLVKQG
ncbi:MAG: hypothetical protein VX966_05890 [Chloroflexota bacterium]|nr:hypothetical protein [Chloroflexota bacterium]